MSQVAEVTVDAGYEAAKSGLAYYSIPNPGTLLISGTTRVDYLQRQTTNDLGLLSPTRVLPNILTNASGRILEVFTLVQLGEQIALLSQPGHAPGLATFFKKNLFFNDQVAIEDASSNWTQLELRGPHATAALANLGFATTPALDDVVTAQLETQTIFAFGIESFDAHPAFKLLIPAAVADQLTNQLTDLAAVAFSASTRDLLRIEVGLPGDHEFTDANTPFEIGLARYVSDSKGCYTGQEVLARQVTYDKIVRQLATLSSDQLAPLGAAVQLDTKTIGTVTSASVSPTRGPLALAVLRRPFSPGDVLSIANSPAPIPAKVL